MGRRDQQVKVRGYRIELGEIERCLSSFIGISECTVTAVEDEKGSRYLCAYVVGVNEEKIEISELKDYLSRVLPDFTVPPYVVQMDKLPLGRTGKIDRSKLPDPRMSLPGNFTAPRDEIEEKVIDTWSDVLGISRELIGIGANFFELGGHSLKATVLTAKIHKVLNVKVPLVEIFNRQTVRELCQYIRNAVGERFFAVDKVEEREYYALSAAQKRLYIIRQMDPESTRYNMPYVFPLPGDADKGQLEKTFGKLIERHESFRTSFHMIDDKPVQTIHETVEFEVAYYDLAAKAFTMRYKAKEREEKNLIQDVIRPFDLSKAPLLRVVVMKTGDTGHLLLVEMHHIISDGTSQGILEREFTALSAGEELPPLRLQYRDYAEWQNSNAQQAIMKKQEKYWLEEFSGELPVLNLPADFPRPAVQSVEGRRLRFYIDAETTRVLYGFSRQMEATLYMLLLAVYHVLLAKLSGQGDIIIGTPTAGRRHADLQDIIGMFVNTLSMRNYPEGDKKFIEFLQEVKTRTLDAYDNQEYQFEDLVDNISPRRDTGRNPIFDVVFNLLNQADHRGGITGEDTDALYDEGEVKANFDIVFQGIELSGVIYFAVNYCTTIYKEETVKGFIRCFKRILAQVKENPTREISSMELVSGEEKRQLLVDFNDTAAEYPANKTIHELFAEQAKRTPDHIAIVGAQHAVPLNGGVHLTYRELNRKSNRLANVLRGKGAGPGTIVGIMAGRSPEMVTGILGILKSGGAYLPVNPDYPRERIDYMLQDSNAAFLLTAGETLDVFKGTACCAPTNCNLHRLLAYIIYTSGSTGKPKGVMVAHRSVINFAFCFYDNYDRAFNASDYCLSVTDLSFDVSVGEIFVPFFFGSRIVMLSQHQVYDPWELSGVIIEKTVTFAYIAPHLLDEVCRYLHDKRETVVLNKLLVGVEPIKDHQLRAFLELNPSMRIINGYGPTEATICATFYRYGSRAAAGGGNIPIGGPLANTAVMILADGGCLSPVGIPGELCIAGAGLARGYLNRPELTAEKFDHDLWDFQDYHDENADKRINEKLLRGVQGGSFLEKSPPGRRRQRIYKTGDLARWQPDGNIQFLGRLDFQVKIRGYRIEPGEIESCLAGHPGVKQAVVVDRVDNTGNKYLCAYVVSHSSHSSYLSYLSGLLPHYMVPAHIVEMAAIPLTPGGKVDRRALPGPEVIPGDDYTAPMNKLEEKLADIWSAVLGIDKQRIGSTSNFFDIGGHSLRAIAVISRIHKELDARVPMLELFKNPSIRGLARFITGAVKDEFTAMEAVEEKAYYPLSYNQKRLWFLRQIDPHSPSYHLSGSMVLNHGADESAVRNILYEIMERHESFRTAFKEVDNEPVQWIAESVDIPFTVVDITSLNLSEEEKKRKIEEVSARVAITPFDLEKPPLFRAALLELEEGNAWFVYNMHHIITDGWSMEILKAEFAARYEGYRGGARIGLGPPALRYRDFAWWQNRYFNNPEVKERFQRYWREKLEPGIPPFKLPYDYREVVGNPGSAGYRAALPQEINEGLQQLAKEENTTIYIVMLALLNILLARLSGQEDVVTGVLGAGREHLSLHNVVGFFVNTLILKTRVDYNESFPVFLRRVNGEVLEMMNYQAYPLELVFDDLNLRFPEISVLYNMFTRDPAAAGMELDSFESYHLETVQEAKFDLVFYVSPYKNGLDIQCHYRKDLFKKEKVEFIIREYAKLSRYAALDPNKSIKDYLFEKRKKRKGWMKESRSDIS
jgi:amino acid adenylation domain-containing protein